MNTYKVNAGILKQHPANMLAVTPSDVSDIKHGILYVKNGGTVYVDLQESGQNIPLIVEDETFLPIVVKKVYSTGTTASNIYVCW